MQLTLSVDERKALPRAASEDQIFSGDVSSHWPLIPERRGKLDSIYPEFRYLVGGPSVRAGWADHDVLQEQVDLFLIKDGYLFPAFGVVISSGGLAFKCPMEEAAYFSADLCALPDIDRNGGGIEFAPRGDIQVIERAIVTFPWGALNNYGHFLLDCLSGVAATRAMAEKHRIPYVFPPLNAWQVRHLALFDIESVTLEKSVYAVRNLIFTSCMGHFLHKPNVPLRSIATMQKRTSLTSRIGRQVYLSRRGNKKRIMTSEESMEELLSSNGFDIIKPELLSIDDQIEVFSSSDIIVGNTGAGFSNAIYCKKNTLIIEVQPDGMNNVWVRNLAALCNLRWAVYFCSSNVTNKDYPESGMTFDYDINEFLQFIYKAIEL